MSRTVRDSALLLQVLAGHYPRDAGSLRDTPRDYLAAADADIGGLRMAWSPDFGHAAVDPEIADTASRAARVFEGLGCSVDEADLVVEAPFDAFWALFSAISAARYESMVKGSEDALTEYARECIEYGSGVSGADFVGALGARARMRSLFAELFERYDVLLSPTMPVGAFPVGEPPAEIAGRQVHRFSGFVPFTYPINMIGHPAASIPCGFTSSGLPVGLHIIGRWGDEATVIAVSAAFERARPWSQHRPPVS
jgi:aspartyl-tRNA(Asn)/glutamyl-tRNA(Gln) amidotransferase subunit A